MVNVQFTQRPDVVSGMWKFRDTVSEVELTLLAGSWKEAEPDKYLDLHIRKCSKDQIGIGFQYVCGYNDQEHRKFFERMTDELKRRFGNNFAGWDISQTTIRIGIG